MGTSPECNSDVSHQYSFRGKDLVVQLQPTDALLCITNLPTSFTLEEFEELVLLSGMSRDALSIVEVTGHSKGYGFVEYMKKDFAAKARLVIINSWEHQLSSLHSGWMLIISSQSSFILSAFV